MTATDILSGPASITYRTTDAQVTPLTTVPGSSASLPITANGVTTVFFHGTDRTDNAEADNSVVSHITRSHIVVDRPSLPFGNQRVATTSAPQTVNVTNNGNLDMNITSIAPDNPDYGESGNCGSTLAAGSICQVNVTFGPTAAGPDNGTLTITSDADNSP